MLFEADVESLLALQDAKSFSPLFTKCGA